MTHSVASFLAGRSPGSGLYVERGEGEPTVEALRWSMEIRAMLGMDTHLGLEALAFLAACLRSCGAYAIAPDQPKPMLNATYYAARVLVLASETRQISPMLPEWLASVTFGPSENVRLDVDDLFYVMRALEAADASIPLNLASRTVAFLQACARPFGGFGLLPGEPADIERTYCCALMLQLLGALGGLSEHRAFIDASRRNGLFLMRPDSPVCSLATQYWGSRAAELCGSPISRDALREFTTAARNPDGGFGGENGDSTLWHTYCALKILARR